jgi:4-amino-4-deoxy-L-arabinose transferase-like glycosyltransferase
MQTTSPELNGFAAFVRRNYRYFLFWSLVALAFRILFLIKFPLLTNDSFVYGDIAKNWLQHGVYGFTAAEGVDPTYIRLPGYPGFLLLTWLVAGVEQYNAALIVQIFVDVLTCLVIADLARRIASETAAKIAFVLAVLCPFFANYAAVALTETWAIFFAALAMDAAVAAFEQPSRRWFWVICGVALAAGILLRPDGGMLWVVIGGYALWLTVRRRAWKYATSAVFMGAIALAPLAPWTIRNWRVFHLFQPLTPLNANMPDEFVPRGFHKWVRTWMVDYASVEDVWFKVDGSDVRLGDLPARAIDDAPQRQRTEELFKLYKENGDAISPEIDAAFDELARERIRSHPLRYYFGLPVLRATDLWLRPRTEMLPLDQHWWRLREEDPREFRWAALLGAVNLIYVIAALVALARGRVRYAGIFILFALLRTAFLAGMPNPEPRYVLECYPALLAIAGAAFCRGTGKATLRKAG